MYASAKYVTRTFCPLHTFSHTNDINEFVFYQKSTGELYWKLRLKMIWMNPGISFLFCIIHCLGIQGWNARSSNIILLLTLISGWWLLLLRLIWTVWDWTLNFERKHYFLSHSLLRLIEIYNESLCYSWAQSIDEWYKGEEARITFLMFCRYPGRICLRYHLN